MKIRKYQADDKDSCQRICLETFRGKRSPKTDKILLLLYNDYYLEKEPLNAFVLTDDETVCGYILTSESFPEYREIFINEYLSSLKKLSLRQYLLKKISLFIEGKIAKRFPSHLHIDILSPKVFRNIDKLINSGEKFAITKHYLRDCIYEEMLACMQYRKEDAGNILKLYAKYKEENFPSNYGLTENNVIFREHNDAEVIKLMEDWWYMVENYSKRDQLSLMYVCWKNNFKISSLFKKPLRFCIRDIFILYKHKADKK